MRKNLISLVVVAFTALAAVSSGYAAGERALIAAVPGFKGGLPGLMRAAAAGKSAGWRVPTHKQNNVPISGTWKFSTYKGVKGTITFGSGNKISYGSGKSSGAFTSYGFLSNKNEPNSPILVSLKGGGGQGNFMPFIKGKQMILLSITNKRQWISLSK
ncbi:hypothetical protein ACQQ2Q_19810 [Agrobacterium sp. ES01]|uniref:hypothetical protein n=1 Tax=Agrobacterium sp. ES01 TaxID=3420714 RepID=UPI003D147264